jgi:hypothetical protein
MTDFILYGTYLFVLGSLEFVVTSVVDTISLASWKNIVNCSGNVAFFLGSTLFLAERIQNRRSRNRVLPPLEVVP